MVDVREVSAKNLIDKLKEELKKIEDIKPLGWSKFVKSGMHKQRIPEQEDFWYIRSSSILRRIYLDGPVGVERLRTFYGGRKSRGSRPARFRKASGNMIRKILQQLEKAGLVEKAKKGKKISSKGKKFLDKIAFELSKK
jgi:small subunit ribosomal protein S19e